MENMKFRVNSPGHSEEIQRELFKRKIGWWNGGSTHFRVILTDKNWLFVDGKDKLTITAGDKEVHLLYHTETTLEELKAM